MKLLNKTLLYYIVVSAVIFLTGGLVLYELVRSVIIVQTDSSLLTEKDIIEEQILHFDSVPDFTTVFGHQIEVQVYNYKLAATEKIVDTAMTDTTGVSIDYRHLLVTDEMFDGRGFRISIYKSLQETHQLIADIIIVTFLVLILMALILVVVNYWISRLAWIPFYDTLKKISEYNLKKEGALNLVPSRIREFNRLNKVLTMMSEKIREDFTNLKEFTEDASHEIQTPLSIIKSRIELLFQAENLTPEQMQNISVMYDAVARLSKLNTSLLLLSKIQNDQYAATQKVDLTMIIDKFLDNFQDIIQQKNISVTKNYIEKAVVEMNPNLAEIMISNLLGNALKHNISNGFISITLSQAEFVISNSGLPMDMNVKDLFQRFRKANPSSESAGLGLAIVKKIITSFNFDISFSTEGNTHTLKISF